MSSKTSLIDPKTGKEYLAAPVAVKEPQRVLSFKDVSHAAAASEVKVERLPDKVDCVELDILAALKIVKHCQDGLPGLVTGNLLGICSQKYVAMEPPDLSNILEISYSVPNEGRSEEEQTEMMQMFEKASIDNNCVGWYLSNHLVELYFSDTAKYQYIYQIDHKTPHCVLIIYDPFQSKLGNLVLKAYRLSEKYMAIKARNMNDYIAPNEIYDELPLRIMSTGLSSMYIRDIADTNASKLDCNFDALSMSTNDKRIESSLVSLYENIEETEKEQSKFISYSKYQFQGEHPPRVKYFKHILQKENENLKAGRPIDTGINLSESVTKIKMPICSSRIDQSLSLGHLDHTVSQLQDMVNTNLKNLVLNKEVQNNGL
jgi:hypothetical protein